MDKIYEQTMLFDFYGELLTEHQRSVYEDAVYHDLSLSEIAEERGISRQGVHDLLRRCDGILQDYESKLHLVERFTKAKKTVEKIEQLTLPSEDDGTDCTVEDTTGTMDTADIESAAGTVDAADTECTVGIVDAADTEYTAGTVDAADTESTAGVMDTADTKSTTDAAPDALQKMKERLADIRILSQELLKEL